MRIQKGEEKDPRSQTWLVVKPNHLIPLLLCFTNEIELLVTECTWKEEEYGQRKQDIKCNPWISGSCKWMVPLTELECAAKGWVYRRGV